MGVQLIDIEEWDAATSAQRFDWSRAGCRFTERALEYYAYPWEHPARGGGSFLTLAMRYNSEPKEGG